MDETLIIRNPQIFTGYSHLGSCREFIWYAAESHPGSSTPARFKILDLQCDCDLEALMIRKDLFLHTPEGGEFVVANFQIIDVSSFAEIRGIATACRKLMDEFPEVKILTTGEPLVISKKTHLQAFRAVSAMVSSAHTKQTIDPKDADAVINELSHEITKSPEALLNLLAIKSYDDYTFSHNINVATLSMLIGHAMGLSRDQMFHLGKGALMHDLGKLKISQRLLAKQGHLSRSEFSEIAQHPVHGIDLITGGSDLSPDERAVILHHHEKFEGKGYPHGQAGSEISLLARVCAIADVFDALTTDRPFRPALTPYEAIRVLLSGVNTQFDPEILHVFLHRISLYPPGSPVEMEDGSQAVVIRSNPGYLLRPVVKLLDGPPGPHQIIDLKQERTRYIKGPKRLNIKKVPQES